MEHQNTSTREVVTNIRWFEELDRHSLAEAGGKGANLGELFHAGLPVPPGFVVTAPAYRVHLEAAGLPRRIARQLAGLPLHDLEAITAASREIQEWIMAAPVPSPIGQEIASAYAELARHLSTPGTEVVSETEPAVAVRSSATAEDLPSASFAGQQETFLNVRGAGAVLEAVRRCWASLWTPQAISYRASLGYDHLQVDLAVVVQALVQADVSGVMFTANPVSGAQDEILVSASYGLGEAIVSGMVTPDTFVLSADGAIRQQVLGLKEVRVLPNGSGTRTEPVPSAEQQRYCLSKTDLAALVSLARQVQAHYGSPQDTEWALKGGRLYLLQARPITTTAGTPGVALTAGAGTFEEPAEEPLNRKLFGLKQTLEYWPEPPTPLDLSFYSEAAIGSNKLYQLFGLRPPAELPQPVERSDGRMGIRSPNPRLSPAVLWRVPAYLLFAKEEPLERWQIVAAEFSATLERWRAAEAAARDAASLARLVSQQMHDFGLLLGRRFEAVFMSGVKYLLLVKFWTRLVGGKAGAAELEDRLMRAVPFRTALQNGAVAGLAQTAAAHGQASPQFEAALADFMAEWGSRPARGMASMPSTLTWREDPGQVVGLVTALLSDPAALPGETGSAQEADYLAARAQTEAALWPPLRKLFRTSLERARNGVIAREDSLFRIEIMTAFIRHTVLRLGQQLTRAGILTTEEDVFFLLLPELLPVAEGKLAVGDRISRRKAGYSRVVAAHERGQHWLVTTGSIPAQAAGSKKPAAGDKGERATITGLAASAGQAVGPACVIHSPDEFSKMRKGAVLVAPFTAPAWTPLFRLAAAVVTDIGSPVSHAAIVAREYGLPAVVATGNASSQLKDGQQLRVDGSKGVVTVLDPESKA